MQLCIDDGCRSEEALAEGHRILNLLKVLSTSDSNAGRRTIYKSAATMIRKALR